MLAKANELQDIIASRSSLGKIIGDKIKQELGLPANAFQLTLDFQDADANVAGFQAAAIVKIDIDKTVTKTVGFDLNLPDLGPVELASAANLDFTVGGHLDLDFGFRFGTFTPYLLNTTSVALNSSINSNVNASASVGSVKGTLDGKLQLKNSTSQTIPSGNTTFTLASNPTDSLVVVSRSGSVSGATNATPIVITTSAVHGLRNGQYVTIDGVLGNTNANGSYYAKVLTANTFELYTNRQLTQARNGNAAYTSGGSWSVALSRGSALGAGVDYTMSSASPPQITFANATTSTTRVTYSLASATPAAAPTSVGFSIDSALVPSDNNTIGGIPFTQILSSTIPLLISSISI